MHMNQKPGAKVRGFCAYSKYSATFLLNLLRLILTYATNTLYDAFSCRETETQRGQTLLSRFIIQIQIFQTYALFLHRFLLSLQHQIL